MQPALPLFRDLQTERLTLRALRKSDADNILAHFGDPDVSRYLLDEEPFTDISEALGLIEWYSAPEPRNRHRWLIERKSDGAFLGTCGYHCWDSNNNICELGYDLAPAYWGMGYMSEALGAALAFGFGDMGLNRVHAFVYIDNARSFRLLERLGFTREGVMRDKHLFRGVYYDHYCYSLLKREYVQNPNVSRTTP